MICECSCCTNQSFVRCFRVLINCTPFPTVSASHTYQKPYVYKSVCLIEAQLILPAAASDLCILRIVLGYLWFGICISFIQYYALSYI